MKRQEPHAAAPKSKPKATKSVASSKKVTLPSGDRLALLRASCGQDDKCVCINHAIFKHDSSWATAGVGARALNPCNLRPPKTWKPSVPFTILPVSQVIDGKRTTTYFAKFKTLEDGVTACVETYKRFYSELPPAELVSRWTDGGGQGAYQSAVNKCFI